MSQRHSPAARIARIARRAVATLVAVVVLATVAVVTTSFRPTLPGPGSASAGGVSHDSFQLSWAGVERAAGYRVTVALDPAFERVVWRKARTTSTSLVVDGAPVAEHTTYYARVNALDEGRNVSLASPTVSLRTPWAPPGAAGKPKVTRKDTSGFAVAWRPGALAEEYRTVVASDAGFTKDVQESTVDKPALSVKVRDGRRYYVRVTPVRKGLTARAVTTTVVTPLKRLGAPGRVFAEPLSSSSLRVAWPKATNATGYTVQLLRRPGAKPTWTTTTAQPSALIEHLVPAKHRLRPVFYVKVVANRYDLRTSSSRTVAATLLPGSTKRATSFRARVSSYNLLKPTETDAERRSWKRRYAAASKALRGMDLVGLQETPWKALGGKRPVLQVAKKAGLALARHPRTKKPCTTQSEPILYRAARFTVVRCGFQKLDTTGPKKWATWAVLRERASGRKVLVVNAHLLAYLDSSSTSHKVQAQRVRQARRLEATIARHNRAHLPVIVVGDLNSYPNRAEVTPLDVLARAGLVSAELVAAKRFGAEFASFHGFSASRLTGRHLDHVLVDRQSDVLTYRVRHTDVRRAPSDHFQIVTTIAVH
ncbi:endonuclease/exonuclease/phosphatase family protein [Cellulomonas edaphi]|uniref:Endonuclease/exonuclease/phosphatase family protein n=1 Tax=Cellulomonas edaphi TaxID=3053468 RepID=A0ABT7S5V3_9CELL|nr:endonuclease/exonuclease/phosphatase family protein [Cellulomons edaphi]MDM7831000.1 endonuclease/exonuclease/phosphatase family protein [Cellulomons edaphi]